MTRKQQEQEMKNIREARDSKTYSNEELARWSDLLSCVSMIDSILCYSGLDDIKQATANQVIENERQRNELRYLKDYIDEFGLFFVKRMIDRQIHSIHHIERNTFTDDEGLRYNSIVYVDEL